ncbi:MAG: hypothetical protein KR126chlam1_01049 [Chlamydiae bacterium]|nr:hypothetical protein [Chlamydiota bacterium]
MNRSPLFLPFTLALFAHFFSTLFFPSIRILAFVPFLVILFQRKSLLLSLWAAALCGGIVDLSNSDSHFGLFALSYLSTAVFMFPQRIHFFEDRIQTLPIYTFIFSLLFTIFHFIFFSFFHGLIRLSWKGLTTNFLFTPMLDGLYAFFWFTCPLLLYTLLTTRKRKYKPKGYYS